MKATKSQLKRITARLGQSEKPSKFRAIRTKVDGVAFDSKAEAKRYGELAFLQKANIIKALAVHPGFIVKWPKTDITICLVELDFSYLDEHGLMRYEDVKGVDTAVSKIKRKLVEQAYGIKVEVLKR